MEYGSGGRSLTGVYGRLEETEECLGSVVSMTVLIWRRGPESLLGSEVVTECHDLQCKLVLGYDHST